MASEVPSGVSAAAIRDLDFYSDQNVTDPVTAYHQMLSCGPVVWLPQNGMHAICGFAEVTATLRDHRCFQSGKGVSINDDVNCMLIGSTLHSDPPQHDKTRAITFAPLTPKALETVRARIDAQANLIADQESAKGSFDTALDQAPICR